MTIGNMRAVLRCRSVEAWCTPCGHHAIVDCDRFPGTMPVPDVALRLTCSSCGSRRVITKPNTTEFYANLPGGQGRHPNQK